MSLFLIIEATLLLLLNSSVFYTMVHPGFIFVFQSSLLWNWYSLKAESTPAERNLLWLLTFQSLLLINSLLLLTTLVFISRLLLSLQLYLLLHLNLFSLSLPISRGLKRIHWKKKAPLVIGNAFCLKNVSVKKLHYPPENAAPEQIALSHDFASPNAVVPLFSAAPRIFYYSIRHFALFPGDRLFSRKTMNQPWFFLSPRDEPAKLRSILISGSEIWAPNFGKDMYTYVSMSNMGLIRGMRPLFARWYWQWRLLYSCFD